VLERLEPGELVRDATVRGFFVEVGRSGGVSFKIQPDLRQGARSLGLPHLRSALDATRGQHRFRLRDPNSAFAA
jgi:hypothetical protein